MVTHVGHNPLFPPALALAHSPPPSLMANAGPALPPPLPEAPCVAPWTALLVLLAAIVVIALVYMVTSAMSVAHRNKQSAQWKDWTQHVHQSAGFLADAKATRDWLQQLVGKRGAADLIGSTATGAVQKHSDIDIRISAVDCAAYSSIAADLLAAGLQHEHSGTTSYALFSTVSANGRPVDVSLSVQGTDPTAARGDVHNDVKGVLEYLARRRHEDICIRQEDAVR